MRSIVKMPKTILRDGHGIPACCLERGDLMKMTIVKYTDHWDNGRTRESDVLIAFLDHSKLSWDLHYGPMR